MHQLKPLSVAVAATALLLTTAACGGSPEGVAATDQPDGTAVQGGPQNQQLGGPGFPGATGEVAAISGRTLQVQNPMSGQVAVTYTATTKFTEQVTASADDLDVGDCVMVQGDGDETVAATSVAITPAADGSCTPDRPGGGPAGGPDGGPGFDSGDRPEGAPSDLPSDLPTELPSGAPDRMMMMGAFGEVTAVASTGFTVETSVPGEDTPTSRSVTTSQATTWTDTVSSDAQSLAVGRCVVAQGTKDSTGAVTAKRIAVSRKVEGQCGMGTTVRLSDGQP